VFVEGPTDKHFVDQYVTIGGLKEVVVYEIASVDIPFAEFKHLAIEDNNRGRLIFLASALERAAPRDLVNNVVCIIDADFDYLYEVDRPERLLLTTDHTALELYAYDSTVLSKFLAVVLGTPDVKPQDVLDELAAPLRELFLIRAANQALNLGLSLLPIRHACSLVAESCVFDLEDYGSKLLNKKAKWSERDVFFAKIAELRTHLPQDVKRSANGHDFVGLLCWYLSGLNRPKRAYDLELFAGALMGCVENENLNAAPLFRDLRGRLSRLVP
jgi:hypothetical protein